MRVTRVFNNGNSQAVRLPKEFRMDTHEVFIRRDSASGDLVLSRRPAQGGWAGFFALRARTRLAGEFLAERPLNTTSRERDPFAAAGRRRPVRKR